MKAMIPLLSALVLASCATADSSAPDTERRVFYECDRDGGQILVVFAGDTARIESETHPPIVMQRQVSGSGFWYESGTHSIRGKGDEITYTIGRMVPMTCTALRPMPR